MNKVLMRLLFALFVFINGLAVVPQVSAFELHNYSNDMCLSIAGNSTSAGANLVIWPCHNGSGTVAEINSQQFWMGKSNCNWQYGVLCGVIVSSLAKDKSLNFGTGLVLGVAGGDQYVMIDNSHIVTWTYDGDGSGSGNQYWALDASAPSYTVDNIGLPELTLTATLDMKGHSCYVIANTEGLYGHGIIPDYSRFYGFDSRHVLSVLNEGTNKGAQVVIRTAAVGTIGSAPYFDTIMIPTADQLWCLY